MARMFVEAVFAMAAFSEYTKWNAQRLKLELLQRDAVTRGEKIDLIERQVTIFKRASYA